MTLERRDVSPTDADAVATRRNQSEDFRSAAQGARSELSAILEGLATFSAEEWPDVGRATGRLDTETFMPSINWGRRFFGRCMSSGKFRSAELFSLLKRSV